jgi:hypothetical protein
LSDDGFKTIRVTRLIAGGMAHYLESVMKHIGYKAFDKDLKCRGFQFEIGKTYEINGTLTICKNGFHFCKKLSDVFNYYSRNDETRVCEILAEDIIIEGDKAVTNKITIIREIFKDELDNNSGYGNSGYGNSGYGNSGNRNSGYGNSGNRNSGNRNSGDWNSGDWNSGDGNSGNRNSGYGNSGNRNSGNRNSGDWNSGDWNSGDGNSGNRNSGYGNSGNRNSGDWNSGDGNSGYFCTKVPIYLFNKPSNLVYTKEFENQIRSLNVKPILQWVCINEMTEQEKKDNPSSKITGGFLRKTNRRDWTKLTDANKKFILSLPNYNDEVFKQITGISLLEEEMVEVIINNKKKTITKKQARELGLLEE